MISSPLLTNWHAATDCSISCTVGPSQRHRAVPSSGAVQFRTHNGQLGLRLRRVVGGVTVEWTRATAELELITCWALLRSQEEFLAYANRDRLRFDDPHTFARLQWEFEHALAQPAPSPDPPEQLADRDGAAQHSALRVSKRPQRFRPLRPAGLFVPSHPGLWGSRRRLRSRHP